jgi:DNA polymerase II small subunit/DNA polymerase delta subunit B
MDEKIWSIKVMKNIVLICFLSSFYLQLFAQKRLADSVSVLGMQIDSLKSQLADARRAWKKCSEQQNVYTVEMTEQQTRQVEVIKNWQEKYIEIQNRYQNLGDSLKKTIETTTLLQKVIADKAIEQSMMANKAALLAQKLKDSLVDIPKNLCYIYSREKDVYVVLSDTLLFGSNFYLSNQGKQFLERLLKLIRNETSSFVNIKTFANRAAKKQEIWLQANNRSRVLTTFFENIYFP